MSILLYKAYTHNLHFINAFYVYMVWCTLLSNFIIHFKPAEPGAIEAMPMGQPPEKLREFISMGDHVVYHCTTATSITTSSELGHNFPPDGEAIVCAFAVGQLKTQIRRFVIVSHKNPNFPLFFLPMGSLTIGEKEQASSLSIYHDRSVEYLDDILKQIGKTPAKVAFSVHPPLPLFALPPIALLHSHLYK